MAVQTSARKTLVFLIPCSEGHFGSKIDQKTHSRNQNQVQGPTESFLAQRNRRFLYRCARWSKLPWRQTFLALPHGIPSHDTFGRGFARLNPQQFQKCFLSWAQAVAQLTAGALVSLDGKTVKASFDRATAASPWHMLSAWCPTHGGLVVGQTKTDSKSNEITAIPELLRLLAIKGCIVTIDAMGCQTSIAGQIRDQEGDYLLALKSKHKKAYTAG